MKGTSSRPKPHPMRSKAAAGKCCRAQEVTQSADQHVRVSSRPFLTCHTLNDMELPTFSLSAAGRGKILLQRSFKHSCTVHSRSSLAEGGSSEAEMHWNALQCFLEITRRATSRSVSQRRRDT